MKILSWNIERPQIHDSRKDKMIKLITSLDADLIFLTETNSDIHFENYHSLQTLEQSPEYEGIAFKKGENKATIFSKYPIIEELETYDKFSSVCGKVNTALGELVLYGSIIGFLGGKGDYFKLDLEKQMEDIQQLCANNQVCFSGDLNISFSGYPYPSKAVIERVNKFFKTNRLINTTAIHEDSAIHIVLSESILKNREVKTQKIEVPRSLSDHNIVITEIN